jgi:hypothetical protein
MCPDCKQDKPIAVRKDRTGGLKLCQDCWNKRNVQAVLNTRRRHKEILVAELGGKCLDCGLAYAPFVMQFDHRDPALKEFALSGRFQTASMARKRAELKKCDLVCANCHAWRTHRQRCSGCKYCEPQMVEAGPTPA